MSLQDMIQRLNDIIMQIEDGLKADTLTYEEYIQIQDWLIELKERQELQKQWIEDACSRG